MAFCVDSLPGLLKIIPLATTERSRIESSANSYGVSSDLSCFDSSDFALRDSIKIFTLENRIEMMNSIRCIGDDWVSYTDTDSDGDFESTN